MLSLFGSLKGFLKRHEVQVDNFICQLHYKATVLFLIAFSLAVTSQQYLGSPIECHHDSKFSSDFVNTYCWISATFSLPKSFAKITGVNGVIYPGVDKTEKGDERTYHAYYQWVCFVLFIQAAMFYTPRWLWKTWEGGRIGKILQGLGNPMLDDEEQKKKTTRLVQYLIENKNNHNFYAYKYFFCEALNLLNVVGQIYFVDRFLGGEFTTYGLRVVEFLNSEPEGRVDPMMAIFPRMTKCILHKGGVSGDIELFSVLCVLPLNIFNEKIYVFLWFWFVILSICTGLVVGYRIVLVLLPQLRLYALRTVAKSTPMKDLRKVSQHSDLGDWFILYNLGRNVDPINFKRLMIEYSFNLRCEESTDRLSTTEEHQFMNNPNKHGMAV